MLINLKVIVKTFNMFYYCKRNFKTVQKDTMLSGN